MYLEQYGDEMNPDNTDTPIWKLYKAKLKEYDLVTKEIKALEYWMKKKSVNIEDYTD